ncbi:MAG: hypothetical protein BGO77_08460 [Caedibacter sp. 37-49]|nr:MAG: hypothetical protein BGO77_08460 [Caedibacter sp. 37-49]
MGRLKDEQLIDKSFGEAIVEVRGINSVSELFLRKCQLSSEISGVFLVNYKEISAHALALFQYLQVFGIGEFDEDIKTGFFHAFRQ